MSDQSEPPVNGPPEARLSGYRYGVVLLLLLATFLFLTAGLSGKWVPLVTVVLEGATLLATLAAAHARRRLVRPRAGRRRWPGLGNACGRSRHRAAG